MYHKLVIPANAKVLKDRKISKGVIFEYYPLRDLSSLEALARLG